MERRDTGPGSDVNQPGSDGETCTSKAWQTVRRALGKLFSRVGVRRVEDAERLIPAPVLRADLAVPPPVLSFGAGWKPTATVRQVSAPQAGTGMRESDLLPTVTLVRGDYALDSLALQAMPIATAENIGVGSASLDWPVGVTRLPESFLRLPASPVRIEAVPFPVLPKTLPLRDWPVKMPGVAPLRLPRPADPRIRWGGDSVLRRMPVTRRSKEAGMAASLTAERRRLAETAHLETTEVELLGVYPDVPILAVERIVVEDEGRQLRLWLKPEVLRGRSAPHRITLLVGRQISTGKMLQAAL